MLIGEGQDWLEGLQRAWEILSSISYEGIRHKSQAEFDKLAEHYILTLFNEKIYISPKKRLIWGGSKLANFILRELPHYSKVSILWYLIQSKDIPPSGNLISPREVDGGLIFTQGSHMLPLDKLIEKYANDTESFIKRGILLGGEYLNYGDASVKLFPFPRVPVTLLLWKHDEEFPARADILFDSTCSEHLPTDIIWSTAMMTILVML